MNIRKLFNSVPREDAFLTLAFDIDGKEPETVFPEYKPHDEGCVCIYGISESELDNALLLINAKADDYADPLRCSPLKCVVWCKPIFLFETRKCAHLFKDFANLLTEEDFYEFIGELQLDYNEPWTHVQMITHAQLNDIVDYYKDIFEYCFYYIF